VRPQSIASPSTAEHTDTQYNSTREIQVRGTRLLRVDQGAGCVVASIRRAGAIHRKQVNDRNSLNIQPIIETPPLAGSWEQALVHSVQQCHHTGDQRQPYSIMRCHSLQTASIQVPTVVNPELARCSKRCPRLAGASSVAYPAWGEEESKKPPGLRQAMPPTSSASSPGLRCRCELHTLLASHVCAAAAAAASLARPNLILSFKRSHRKRSRSVALAYVLHCGVLPASPRPTAKVRGARKKCCRCMRC
jgi:hypothetical protein